MQDIMPPVAAGSQLIQSYGASGFRIGNAEYASHVLVLPTATHVWNGALALPSFSQLIAAVPAVEILLIGTGARHEMIPAELKVALKSHGLAVDTMDTGAACRTFNVLLAEGRRVATALLLPTIP